METDGPGTAIGAVVFDVGETIVDETRHWTELAADAGVTPFTLMAAVGATIEAGEDHRTVWDRLGIERPARRPGPIGNGDLYPDAEPTLRAVRAGGRLVGLAGNQPEAAEQALRSLDLPVDFVASSGAWGVEKPSPGFFARLVEQIGLAPQQIAYVGDRLDNDVLPAAAAGMVAVLVRRGPWGTLHARRPEAARAAAVIDSLGRLEELLDGEPGGLSGGEGADRGDG